MTGASPIPLVTVVVPVVSVSVLGVVVVILPLEERGDPITQSHSGPSAEGQDMLSSGPATPAPIPRGYSHPDCTVCNSLCICCTHNPARRIDRSLPCIDRRNYGNPEKGEVKMGGLLVSRSTAIPFSMRHTAELDIIDRLNLPRINSSRGTHEMGKP